MILELTSAQRRELRARAHSLNPVVMVSEGGLTATVLQEIDRSLDSHELIKVRIFSDEHATRTALQQELCETLSAAPVQHIGKILVVYRPHPDKPEAAKKQVRKRKKPRRTKRSYQG
ncbi:MAG: ribosome assembly RNA-binding protein YhbY [Betaproteobacteria bacterium]|jgi:RNA-binding protein